MLKIAVVMRPQDRQSWTLMKQCGVENAVGGISLRPVPDADSDAQPWSYASLSKAKAAYEQGGMPLAVIESRPPMEKSNWASPDGTKKSKWSVNSSAIWAPWKSLCGVMPGCPSWG